MNSLIVLAKGARESSQPLRVRVLILHACTRLARAESVHRQECLCYWGARSAEVCRSVGLRHKAPASGGGLSDERFGLSDVLVEVGGAGHLDQAHVELLVLHDSIVG